MSDIQQKHPGGRPTLYDPAYCERVIEYGKLGKSLTWIATEIGATRQTLYGWSKEHPEFFDAMTRAREFSQRWWEDFGQEHMLTTGFSASAWSRSMAARFPDDWREKSETKHVGPNDGPLQVEYTTGQLAMAILSKFTPAEKGEG